MLGRGLEQRRQVRDVVRAEDDVDVRQLLEQALAVALADAAADGDEQSGLPPVLSALSEAT